MIQHKAYKFRIYPNVEQQVLLAKTFGCVRLVYNHFLGVKTKCYEEEKKSMSYSQWCRRIGIPKKRKNFFERS